jgi:hypothetical protein
VPILGGSALFSAQSGARRHSDVAAPSIVTTREMPSGQVFDDPVDDWFYDLKSRLCSTQDSNNTLPGVNPCAITRRTADRRALPQYSRCVGR